jgi:broad specificity phosphatase PhoE/RimJ/RimL family protein N-acetyltransferase
MVRLLLARHGETTWNLERRYQGHGDSPLSALGEEQARGLSAGLAGERLDAIYASDLERAWRTAEVVAGRHDLGVVRDPSWRELAYGAWEGLTREEIAVRFPEEWARRQADPAHATPPGGESRFALQRRAVAAVERVRARHAGQTVLVVTHSGLLMALGAWLHGVDLGAGVRPRSSHCGLSSVRWTEDGPAIDFWDDVAHTRPVLTTARLVLRPFVTGDLADAHAIRSDPEVVRFMDFRPEDLATTRAWLDRVIAHTREHEDPRRGRNLAVVDRGTGRVIGWVGFGESSRFPAGTGEHGLGYMLARADWGRGYAPEAVRAVIDYCVRELGARRVSAWCWEENRASARVMEKAGMRFARRYEQTEPKSGLPASCLEYAVAAEEDGLAAGAPQGT